MQVQRSLAKGEHGALSLVGGCHNYVGVSLQEGRATMLVMLGLSLRARWDATLVILTNDLPEISMIHIALSSDYLVIWTFGKYIPQMAPEIFSKQSSDIQLRGSTISLILKKTRCYRFSCHIIHVDQTPPRKILFSIAPSEGQRIVYDG